MTLDEFIKPLGELLAKAKDLDQGEVLAELELQCMALRDEISQAER
jgi:hypothetical protein